MENCARCGYPVMECICRPGIDYSSVNTYMVNAIKRIIVPAGNEQITVNVQNTSITVFADGRPALVKQDNGNEHLLKDQ